MGAGYKRAEVQERLDEQIARINGAEDEREVILRGGRRRNLAGSRLKRGDLVTAVFSGDYGKPRPNVVVQSDRLLALDSVLLCPLTCDLETSGPARILVPATAANNLKSDSLIMVDKITAVPRVRCRDRLGILEEGQLERLNEALALVIGSAD